MLQIRLLGQFDVRSDGKRIVIASRSGQSLLAYLALTAGTPHRREKLAGTLWPETSEENARKNLRQELWRIRKAIPNPGPTEANDYLLSDEYTITFNLDADYWLDVAILERPGPDPQALTSSLSLYQGELMPGFYDDWVVLERERLQNLFESKMELLMEKLVQDEHWTAVQEQCERWLALGSVPEPAYRALMLSHSARGDMAKVSSVYQRCVDDLRDRFSVEPSAETHALYNGLVNGARAPRRILSVQPSETAQSPFNEDQRSALLKTKFTDAQAPAPGEPPFKGLQYFEEADSDLFFGREELTAKLVDCIHEGQSLLAIVGASGSGKSSLVRAGLVPALKQEVGTISRHDARASWQFHIIKPGVHPLHTLAIELTRDSESVTATTTLLDDLTNEPRSLALFVLRKNPSDQILLVVDQFEELFTLCRDEFEREAFIDNLLAATTSHERRIQVVITLRADFYAHLAQYPELRDAVAQHQEYIGPMTTEDLRRAIEEPARCGGWEFEPVLVDLIMRDVGDEPGALPLLSHALLETWKRRAGHSLTLKGYTDAGGVHGAIAHTAESIYRNLSSEQQEIARDIFLRLTELGEGTEDTTRCASSEELTSSAENAQDVYAVLNILAEARLITLGEEVIEVAHEALIREWPTLREWLNQDREGLRLHRHLTETAHDWEILGRDPGALYRGAHLAQAREWATLHPNALNAGERIFLNASIDQEQREEQEHEEGRQRELAAAKELAETQRQSASRLRMRNRIITTVGLIAIILALLAGMFGVQSNQQRTAALKAQSDAEANFRQAEAQRLAAEANKLLLSQGSPELIALLALRSMNTQYTPQGDGALTAASRLNYPEQIIPGPKEAACLAISPDGKYLVIGRGDHSVRLYDIKTGREIRQFVGHTNYVLNVAYSPDGKYIATGSLDKTTRVWDVRTGQELRRFTSQTDSLSGVAFSPDGRYVIGGTPVRIWNITTGEEVRRFVNDSGTGQSVAFSHDGKSILTGDDAGIVQQWDVQTGQELRSFTAHKSGITAVRFSSDDKLILTGSQDATARVWDAATGKELQSFTGHTNTVNGVAFSPDDKYAFTASSDGTARSWDVATGQELGRFTSPTLVRDLAISPDGKSIWIVGDDGMARSWRIKPRTELPVLQDGSGVSGVAFSSDGKLILTGDTNGIAKLWNASTGELLRAFTGHTDVINYGVAFFPDGKKIITSSWDKTVRIWDIATGKELYRFTGHTGPVNTVTFSPDGKYILTGGNDGARIWNLGTGQEVRQLSGVDRVYGAVFSPDGKYIATASTSSDEGTVLWDANTGKMLHRFTGTLRITSVAFSPDSKYLLSTDFDGVVWLWNVQTWKMVRQFVGHSDVVLNVNFSPDGNYIATASYDDTARLWDVQTGQELRRFTGHTSGVENVVFSPDGKYVLTGSDDGTAMLWDVDYHTTMKYLCSRLLRDFTDAERAQYNIKDQAPTCPAK